MRRLTPLAALLAVVGAPLPALAQAADTGAWSGDFGKKAERRSDVVLGLSTGLLLQSASGYPNEIAKLNDPDYYATSGLAAGPGVEFWLGGALADWFTVGVGGVVMNGRGAGSRTSGGAALLRVEAFPFYGLGGHFRDLALFANFGAGGLSLDGKHGRHAAAGFGSVGGGGVAYELVRFGHFAFAPSAEWLLVASEPLTAVQAIFGARLVFYGGPS